jgi:hypothetical protein
MKTLTLFIFILIGCAPVMAQLGFSHNIGFFAPGSISFNKSVFQNLAPNSALIEEANNTTEFTNEYKGIGIPLGAQSNLSVELPTKKDNFLGFNYCSWTVGIHFMYLNDFNYLIENRKKIVGVDSVRHSGGSYEILDSVYTNQYYITHNTNNIGINAAYIVSTDPIKRFSLKLGLGTAVLFGVRSNTSVYKYRYGNLYSQNNPTEPYNASGSNDQSFFYSEQESFNNKFAYGVQAFIPIDIDFRIANKRLFRKIHITLGTRVTTLLLNIPEIGLTASNYSSFNLGLRYYPAKKFPEKRSKFSIPKRATLQ